MCGRYPYSLSASRVQVVDPKRRLTTQEILAHPWFSGPVSDKPLPGTIGQLKRFNARRKLKAGFGAVRTIVHFRMLLSGRSTVSLLHPPFPLVSSFVSPALPLSCCSPSSILLPLHLPPSPSVLALPLFSDCDVLSLFFICLHFPLPLHLGVLPQLCGAPLL